jgi:hypothetical protein
METSMDVDFKQLEVICNVTAAPQLHSNMSELHGTCKYQEYKAKQHN